MRGGSGLLEAKTSGSVLLRLGPERPNPTVKRCELELSCVL